jgi:septal ring factor EnvC (AmiA/AmiB activator)
MNMSKPYDFTGNKEKRKKDPTLIEIVKENNKLNREVKALQQKLLQSQASEARVREALNELTTDLSDRAHKHQQEDAIAVVACGNRAWSNALTALSTPPNTTELEDHVESEIDKRLGEPVVYMDVLSGMQVLRQIDIDGEYLYARKNKQ